MAKKIMEVQIKTRNRPHAQYYMNAENMVPLKQFH